MSVFTLHAHPVTPCPFIRTLTVRVERQPDGGVRCTYETGGEISRLDVPVAGAPVRTDELWRQTCFEAFVRPRGASTYDEFNFSPSGAWAAYRFERYRTGMAEIELGEPPRITCERSGNRLTLIATFGAADRATEPAQLALSAVLRDRDGKVYYWALRHPDGKPDFHHEVGFAALLSKP